MNSVFIIHGADGHPQENWFPWLKKELETIGHQVFVPQFPTPKNQTLKNWLKVINKYQITQDTIWIGQSLGVPFILNLLEEHKARAAFLVAGFTGLAENPYDPGMKTFAQRTFNWTKIKKNCANFEVFHSDDDPYLKLEKGQALADHLKVKLTFIPHAGHFNTASGYQTFPLLLEQIKKLK